VRARSFVQVAHYPPGARYGPRPLGDFEFVWVLSGGARWQVTEAGSSGAIRELDLRPGTLALARPGTIDSYRWESRHPSSHAYVHFTTDQAPGPPATHEWPLTRPHAGHDPLRALCGYLLDLASVAGHAERARSDQVVGLLLELFLAGPFPRAGTLPIPSPLLPALDHVREVWQWEGVRSVRVPELAAAAGMSPAHFSRSFTKTFGCGPAAALELVRLGRAATALQRSNLTISEVAEHHGFADAYHFSKRFARAYLVPPGLFRRSGGEDVDPLGPLTARGLLSLWASLSRQPTSRADPRYRSAARDSSKPPVGQ
jgi:AraC family transcriptional regulator